jgi:hypothetical protein
LATTYEERGNYRQAANALWGATAAYEAELEAERERTAGLLAAYGELRTMIFTLMGLAQSCETQARNIREVVTKMTPAADKYYHLLDPDEDPTMHNT